MTSARLVSLVALLVAVVPPAASAGTRHAERREALYTHARALGALARLTFNQARLAYLTRRFASARGIRTSQPGGPGRRTEHGLILSTAWGDTRTALIAEVLPAAGEETPDGLRLTRVRHRGPRKGMTVWERRFDADAPLLSMEHGRGFVQTADHLAPTWKDGARRRRVEWRSIAPEEREGAEFLERPKLEVTRRRPGEPDRKSIYDRDRGETTIVREPPPAR